MEVNLRVPQITANRSEDEPFRLVRLGETWTRMLALDALFQKITGLELVKAVLALHDHKGELYVAWKDREIAQRLRFLPELAWEAEGEPSCNVTHIVGMSDFPYGRGTDLPKREVFTRD